MERPPSPNDARNPEAFDAIKKALYRGKKIEAIKLHREATGLGLKEAKEAVEKLEAELRGVTPEAFEKKKAGGCASLVVAALLLGGGAAWLGVRWLG